MRYQTSYSTVQAVLTLLLNGFAIGRAGEPANLGA